MADTDNPVGLVLYDTATEGMLAAASKAEDTLMRIDTFRKITRKCLNEGRDYGKIPGTAKLTLLKPGAEKILMVLGLGCSYEVVDKVEDYSDTPYFDYTVRAIGMHNGVIVAEGLGNANTKEKRYANQIAGGKTTAFDLKNTVLKIAEKRAKVDLALHVGALSDVFEQDLDDSAVAQAENELIEDDKPVLARDVKIILALKGESGLSDDEFSKRMKTAYGTPIVKELNRKQARHLKAHLEKLVAEKRDKEALPENSEPESAEEIHVPSADDPEIQF